MGNFTIKNTNGYSVTSGNYLVFPKLSQTEIDALTSIDEGAILYNTTIGTLQIYNGGTWVTFADTTPNLDEVLVVGNTSDNPIILQNMIDGNTELSPYGISVWDVLFSNGVGMEFNRFTKSTPSDFYTYNLPNVSGTISLTNDLGLSQYKRRSFYFEEFQGNGSGTGWVSSVSGGSWGQAQITSNTELGVMRAGTGNLPLPFQRGAAHTGTPASNGQVVVGNGTYKIGFKAGMGNTLYSGSLLGYLFLGLARSIAPTSHTSIMFRSDDGNNWQCITHNGTTQTITNTSVPCLANTYNIFEIEINSDGTEVRFWIDNVLVATHTTNIPTDSLSHIISNNRVSDTAIDVGLFVDWFYYDKTWLTDRF